MQYVSLIDGKPGAYGVTFPDLPGCTAMGETVDDALVQAGEALRDWTRTMVAQGGAIPAPRNVEQLRADSEIQEALADGAQLVVAKAPKPALDAPMDSQ